MYAFINLCFLVCLQTLCPRAISPSLSPISPCELYGSFYVEENKLRANFIVYVEENNDARANIIVFKEENPLYADNSGHWYITETKDFADFSIYFTDDRNIADYIITYTDKPNLAGCK